MGFVASGRFRSVSGHGRRGVRPRTADVWFGLASLFIGGAIRCGVQHRYGVDCSHALEQRSDVGNELRRVLQSLTNRNTIWTSRTIAMAAAHSLNSRRDCPHSKSFEKELMTWGTTSNQSN